MTDSMRRYTGTKSLRARPLTRGEYNEYRGWITPEGENPNDPGYLVEYEDGGRPCDSRHAGYISWSPADVFARSYVVSETHEDRVRIEHRELADRLQKLAAFSRTPTFAALPAGEQELLYAQAAAMTDYEACLTERIQAFDPPEGVQTC